MNARLPVSFALVATLMATAPAPTHTRAADETGSVAELTRKVGELEKELAALRRKLAELGAQPQTQSLVVPRDADAVSEGWPPREFNGQRFYVVPLER